MLMTAQVIPVNTMGPVQTEWTDSTAVVHQDLVEHNVKQVRSVDNIFRLNNSSETLKNRRSTSHWIMITLQSDRDVSTFCIIK